MQLVSVTCDTPEKLSLTFVGGLWKCYMDTKSHIGYVVSTLVRLCLTLRKYREKE